MKALVLALGALALVLSLQAAPASAQYIYLDSNGDGVHTAADVLHGVGPTVVDIWLDIGHNRDGSPVVCRTNPATPMDMFSYTALLEVSDGTVSFSPYVNRVPQMGLFTPGPSTNLQFSTGDYYASAPLPAGKYLLGTVTIQVLTGTPSVHFLPFIFFGAPIYYSGYTLFGSLCKWSLDTENSVVLGDGWSDSDGLAFSPGGGGNQAPSLSPIADMTVQTGGNSVQAITASDPDGQPLAFQKTAGPTYLTVLTTDPGSGSASASVRLAPFVNDSGTSSGTVAVTDGTAQDQLAFGITVSRGPDHPPFLGAVPAIDVMAGRLSKIVLFGGDPDGGMVGLAKEAGPPYVNLQMLAQSPGGSSAALLLSPSLCDVGTASATVSITDGISSLHRGLAINVHPPASPFDTLPRVTPEGQFTGGIALGDFNGDGILDAVVTHEDVANVSVHIGKGDGTFLPGVSYDVAARSTSVVAADMDLDGHVDIVSANWRGSGVSILHGRGDGTFDPYTTQAGLFGPIQVASADLNRDGRPDLVMVAQEVDAVSALLGQADGTFVVTQQTPAGSSPSSLTVGDYNLDGRPDVAVTNPYPGSAFSGITILPGLGDGNFGDPISTLLPDRGGPWSVASADWNGDGQLDLACTDTYAPTVRLFLSNGDGHFQTPTPTARFGQPWGCVAGDVNGDGNADLVVEDPGLRNVDVLLGNGSGGFANPIHLRGMALGDGGVAIGDMNHDGVPDIVVAGPGALGVFLDPFGPKTIAPESRAFLAGANRGIPNNGGAGTLSVLVEPLDGTYAVEQLDAGSISLRAQGTGSVDEIHSLPTRRLVSADRDDNGTNEVAFDFARSDLGKLLDKVTSRISLTLDLTGALVDGRAFCSDLVVNVVPTGRPPQIIAAPASFAPNPLNPTSTLSFTTTRDGAAKVRIYDIQGRTVRTLLDTPRLVAGAHELRFDGKTDRGAALASGVYFYRVESVEGKNEGQIVILK